MALASNETDLDRVIFSRSNFQYADYIQGVSDTIRLIAKDQRAVKTIQAWEHSLPLTVCEPSDEILPGCVYAFDGALQGNLILSGSGAVSSESGTAVINGDVTNNGGLKISNSALEIHGDFISTKGTLRFNHAQVEVLGDFTIERYSDSGDKWYMSNADDRLLVNDDFSSDPRDSNLQAGRVEVKGNFTTGYNGYRAGAEHITVFSGDETQAVTCENSSYASSLGTVYLKNPKKEFATEVYQLTLGQDAVLEGGLPVSQELNLNGHTLAVLGQPDAGSILLNQGNLINVSCEGLLLSVHAELNTIEEVTFVLAGYTMDGKMCKTCLVPFTPESEEKTETFALQAWAECANVKVFAMDADSLPLCSLYKFK